MFFFNYTYPLRCLRVPQVEYHWPKVLVKKIWKVKQKDTRILFICSLFIDVSNSQYMASVNWTKRDN
jgi:hypothetical protein